MTLLSSTSFNKIVRGSWNCDMAKKREFPLAQVYGLLEPGPVVLVTTARAGRANHVKGRAPHVANVMFLKNTALNLTRRMCGIEVDAVLLQQHNASTTPARHHYNARATKGFQWMQPFHPSVKRVDWLKKRYLLGIFAEISLEFTGNMEFTAQ
jgi:hypothetical protein